MITLGIVGCGHWGPNYLRIFSSLPGAKVGFVSDPKAAKMTTLQSHYANVEFTADLDAHLRDAGTQAVVIASPSSTHYELARRCLEQDKHVLVEKPLALKVDQAEELVALARARKRVLMVGHTFLYNPGVAKLKALIDEGKLGKIYYMTAVRTHLGLVREDVNAAWDLAPHDISIFNYLIGQEPLQVSALGAAHLAKGREDVVFINLVYPNDVIALIHVSWADSNKQRRIQVVGSKARIVFDDLDALERVKLYEKGISSQPWAWGFGEFQLMLRDGDIWSPKVDPGEPLLFQCKDFLESIEKSKSPIADAVQATGVVKVMCAIEQSLKSKGAAVKL